MSPLLRKFVISVIGTVLVSTLAPDSQAKGGGGHSGGHSSSPSGGGERVSASNRSERNEYQQERQEKQKEQRAANSKISGNENKFVRGYNKESRNDENYSKKAFSYYQNSQQERSSYVHDYTWTHAPTTTILQSKLPAAPDKNLASKTGAPNSISQKVAVLNKQASVFHIGFTSQFDHKYWRDGRYFQWFNHNDWWRHEHWWLYHHGLAYNQPQYGLPFSGQNYAIPGTPGLPGAPGGLGEPGMDGDDGLAGIPGDDGSYAMSGAGGIGGDGGTGGAAGAGGNGGIFANNTADQDAPMDQLSMSHQDSTADSAAPTNDSSNQVNNLAQQAENSLAPEDKTTNNPDVSAKPADYSRADYSPTLTSQ